MKKFFMLFFIHIILVNSFFIAYAQYDSNPLSADTEEYNEIIRGEYGNSVFKLSELDIIRNPYEKWGERDFISRRSAFEMAYTVFTYGSRILCEKSEIQNFESSMKENRLCYDVDIGTYDNALLYSLKKNTSLFYGKINNNNQCIADFDGNLTYNDAFAIISRLFARDWRYSHDVKKILTESNSVYIYYDLMCDMGLINSNTILSYSSLTVKKENINESITAYEFMHLLYNSLYIPHLASSDYGNRMYGFRYIEALEWFESNNSDKISDDVYCIP